MAKASPTEFAGDICKAKETGGIIKKKKKKKKNWRKNCNRQMHNDGKPRETCTVRTSTIPEAEPREVLGFWGNQPHRFLWGRL